ncbi:MAG: cyclic nucleotide-binding domain-containing protein [Actinomycetota bacterium]
MSQSSTAADALHSSPFFAELPSEAIEEILSVAQPASFEPGSTIVEEGDAADGMYIVVAGTAEVDVGGRFHRLKAGEFFGEMALITSSKRLATVKATEPVEALKIPAEEFRALLNRRPEIAIAMLAGVIQRLREVEQRVDAWMGT